MSESSSSSSCSSKRKAPDEVANQRKLKKRRKRIERGQGTRDDFRAVFGQDARPELLLKVDEFLKKKGNDALSVGDIQSLLLWVLGSAVSPGWVFLKNRPLVSKVVLLSIDGLSSELCQHDQSMRTLLPCLFGPGKSSSFGEQFSVRVPNSNFSKLPVIEAFANCDTSKIDGCQLSKKQKRKNQQAQFSKSKPRNDVPGPTHYLLSKTEQDENIYPSADPVPQGYLCTQPPAKPSELDDDDLSWLIGMDCEMVKTSEGHTLARVTLTSHEGDVLYDRIVKPHLPILDYVSEFSGITAPMMDGVTLSREEARNDVMAILSAKHILVGHSLENDLDSLRLCHARCIDTALLYPHPRGPPLKSSLRYLTKRFLKRKIQEGQDGHCSAEDARAAMDLARLKVASGPLFGLPGSSKCENIMTVISRHRHRCTLIASPHVLQQVAPATANAVNSHSDEKTAGAVLKAMAACDKRNESVELIWAVFENLSQHMDFSRVGSPDDASFLKQPAFSQAATACNSQLERILAAACGDGSTLVIVAPGSFSNRAVKSLQQRKFSAKKEGSVWSEQDELQLGALERFCQRGAAFFRIPEKATDDSSSC